MWEPLQGPRGWDSSGMGLEEDPKPGSSHLAPGFGAELFPARAHRHIKVRPQTAPKKLGKAERKEPQRILCVSSSCTVLGLSDPNFGDCRQTSPRS